MLPLDSHAHIEPEIDPQELVSLRACVVAVTRTLDDFDIARHRTDPSVAWAVGCHPGLVKAIKAFTPSRMRVALGATPFVGEVGLDGTSRVPISRQVSVFREIVSMAADPPRMLSIHSYRATDLVLSVLHDLRPPAAILHWWLGTPEDTRKALAIGALFSVNASQARNWPSLDLIPVDRLLLETDHPFGDRSQSPPRRPGNLSDAERQLATRLSMSILELRRHCWRNMGRVALGLGLFEMFPHEFQVQMIAS